MNRKLQVFVSSTYLDMKEERQAAVEAILEAGHIPAGMELFAASDQSQWQTITNWIDDSDVYMLILGGRYGSIEPESGKSYIEKEYLYALDSEKPLFAVVMSPDAIDVKMVKNPKMEVKESENPHLLRKFRELIRQKMCPEFNDLNHLRAEIFKALSRHDRDAKLPGWVKGSEVVDPKPLLDEINRLRAFANSQAEKLESVEAELESMKGPTGKQTVRFEVNDIEKKILLYAEANEGFMYESGYNHMYDDDYRANMTHRDIARWEAAFNKLRKLDLFNREDDGFSYTLTENGYLTIDQIKLADAKASDDSAPDVEG